MEEVEEVFLKGTPNEILDRAVSILEDTQSQHKRGHQTLDVCFNLEIVKIMIKKMEKGLTRVT